MYDWHAYSITVLQTEASFMYNLARCALHYQTRMQADMPGFLHWDLVAYQQRAAALSLAARVLACIESPLPYYTGDCEGTMTKFATQKELRDYLVSSVRESIRLAQLPPRPAPLVATEVRPCSAPESAFAQVCTENARIDRLLASRLREMAEQAEMIGATDYAALISGAASLEYRADIYDRRARRALKKAQP